MNLDSLKHTWENQDEVSNTSLEINQPLLFSIKVNQQMKKMRNMIAARIIESVAFFIIIVS